MLKLFKQTYEKELAKLNKKYPYKDSKVYKELLVELNFKYNKIDEYTKFKQLIEIEYSDNEKEKELKLLECDKKYNKIDELEYEKRLNDINKNPWAKIHFNYDAEKDADNIQTEIVYNQYFIKRLQEQGYSGNTENDIVQAWLSQVFAANVDTSDLVFDDDSPLKSYVKAKNVKGKKIIG